MVSDLYGTLSELLGTCLLLKRKNRDKINPVEFREV